MYYSSSLFLSHSFPHQIQAEDRCHRIGQQKPVTIIKMITEDTVDSDIYKMQERKSQMNEAILDSNSKARKKKNQDSEEMNNILDLAVSRYQDGK
jgi:SWI/SNF-related matrix-associated actin-dependent regulator 1 of chromatin subfamily A